MSKFISLTTTESVKMIVNTDQIVEVHKGRAGEDGTNFVFIKLTDGITWKFEMDIEALNKQLEAVDPSIPVGDITVK